MKTKINGIETSNGLTVREFAEDMKKKTGFDEFANGFKTNITKEEEPEIQTADDLIKEVGNIPHTYFKDTKPIKERAYANYNYVRFRK